MSTSPTPAATTTTGSARSKKILVPKVWKRPHSTIYGKNVEFGNKLYSDKIGEINGRKFNSELPWTMRNSGGSSAGSSSGQYNQGYLSSHFPSPYIDFDKSNLVGLASGGGGGGGACSSSSNNNNNNYSYSDLLEMTNPHRFSKRNMNRKARESSARGSQKIDFYDQYDLGKEIDRLNNTSLLMNEPLFKRKIVDNNLDFDYELGLFVPKQQHDNISSSSSSRNIHTSSLTPTSATTTRTTPMTNNDFNTKSFVPLPTITQNTKLLPKHECNLLSSPYGQSADGRKLSLGSINPQSYRPSLPQKTTTAHASDGEEIEFHDKSSPFYTDRWAGKTIRHFDSDLYSNANLFKSMIL